MSGENCFGAARARTADLAKLILASLPVDGLNFAGNDLTSLRGPKTARACYRACEKTKGCAAFTFIASQEKSAPKSKCWLKKAGYHRGAEHAVGTVSGVVRRG